MKGSKRVVGLVVAMLLCIIISGCSSTSKAEQSFGKYKELWVQKDFKGMYSMLSSETKGSISEEDFVKRYTNIYSSIGANNLSIEINGEIKKDTENNNKINIPFVLKMDTIAGNIELKDFKISISKENKEYLINWDESLIFPKMIKGDKVGFKTSKAKRGSILDRDGNPLAKDGLLKVVGIHPIEFDIENRENKIKEMAGILDISEETIINKLNENKNLDYFVPIVDILPGDERLSKLVDRQSEGILIKDKESRVYSGGEAVGRLVGYVGSITAEELKENVQKGYTSTSIVGKSGLEKVYEENLRAKDAIDIYIERGEEKIPIINREAKDGENIQIAIDLGLQNKIYSEMNGEKGAATAVDPKTGEIIALVSSPSYDSNVFTTYATKTQKKQWEESNYSNQENRFNKVYSPGSTMKLLTASIGLDTGVLNPEEAKDIKGLTWKDNSTWGGYEITRVKDPGAPVNLKDAVDYSDNIYFSQVALAIGGDKFVEGIKKFGIGEELKAGYPMENSQISNDGNLNDEIKLADTGYGQGEIMVTPLNMALAYSALGNEGNIMKPRLVISQDKEVKTWKENAILSKNLPIIIDAFTSHINNPSGSTADAKIEGFKIAGKTGTAEIKQSKEDKNGTENGWFVGVNVDNPKIALSMVIEDVKGKGGSHFTVPKVKNAMEYYLKR